MPKILVVEDEEALITLLTYNLEKKGFDVICLKDGKEVVPVCLTEKPDLIILDWMLPTVSGIQACKEIRQNYLLKTLPVLMLTARSSEGDKLLSFSTGVDDYVSKPFSVPELIARIQALLRRVPEGIEDKKLAFENVLLDTASHQVTRAGHFIHLGPSEFKILHCFLSQPKKVLSRAFLQKEIWPNMAVDERTVDVHIKRLRQSLNQGGEPDIIRTVRSVGYVLKEIEF